MPLGEWRTRVGRRLRRSQPVALLNLVRTLDLYLGLGGGMQDVREIRV